MRDKFESLTNAARFMQRAPSERGTYAKMPSVQVKGAEPSKVLSADEGYFRLVVADMFLRDRRRYWVQYVPFVLMLTDFIFEGQRRSIPVFAGHDMLKGIESSLRDGAVEYRNTTVIGPVPYAGGDIAFFLGLFRKASTDLTKEVVSLVHDIGQICPVVNLSGYIDTVLVPLERGIGKLLGLQDVEMCMGVRDEWQPDSHKPPATGYFLLADRQGLDIRGLYVSQDQLFHDELCSKPVVEYDYCLLRVDFHADRDFATLPFARLWKDIKSRVWTGRWKEADALFLEMARQLAMCPDVTSPHRFQLLVLLKANLEREKAAFQQARGGPANSIGTFRGGDDNAIGKYGIQNLLNQASRSSRSDKIKTTLTTVAKEWDRLGRFYDGQAESELTDTAIISQLKVIGSAGIAASDTETLLHTLVSQSID